MTPSPRTGQTARSWVRTYDSQHIQHPIPAEGGTTWTSVSRVWRGTCRRFASPGFKSYTKPPPASAASAALGHPAASRCFWDLGRRAQRRGRLLHSDRTQAFGDRRSQSGGGGAKGAELRAARRPPQPASRLPINGGFFFLANFKCQQLVGTAPGMRCCLGWWDCRADWVVFVMVSDGNWKAQPYLTTELGGAAERVAPVTEKAAFFLPQHRVSPVPSPLQRRARPVATEPLRGQTTQRNSSLRCTAALWNLFPQKKTNRLLMFILHRNLLSAYLVSIVHNSCVFKI